MHRSALRILSLLSVLGLVAGIVILTQEPGSADEAGARSPARSAGVLDAVPHDAAHVERWRRAVADGQRRSAAAAEAARVAAARQAEVRRQAAAAAAVRARAAAKARATRNALRDPQAVARILVRERGWSSGQFSCLRSLWQRESGWNHRADNPTSSAYGIPQALPGPKMASAGPDWRTNPVTQITWGLGYIADRYGTPCGAWAHSESHGWY